jgi:hypothetical protein
MEKMKLKKMSYANFFAWPAAGVCSVGHTCAGEEAGDREEGGRCA